MPEDTEHSILERIVNEIVPVLEKVVLYSNGGFPNPYLAECRKVRACNITDCLLNNNGNDPVRCWQVSGTSCNGKIQGDLIQKYSECRECEVFKNSCPTIVELIGEHLNNMIFLYNEQRKQISSHQQNIGALQQELNSALEQLRIREKEIREIMITDKLTTLFNRHHLVTVLEDEISRCQRFGRPLAVILIDIDDFKSFNDMYGHLAGDKMLAFVGSLIKDNTRKFDRAFRYGGEEFVVVLPETDMTMAYIVADRIRKSFENKSFHVKTKDGSAEAKESRTISIGVTATFAFGTQDISIEDLINQTEKALQNAKQKGGNICVRYE